MIRTWANYHLTVAPYHRPYKPLHPETEAEEVQQHHVNQCLHILSIGMRIHFAELVFALTVCANLLFLLSLPSYSYYCPFAVHLAGSKFAITPAKNVGILKFLYALTALELGFPMICALSLYSKS